MLCDRVGPSGRVVAVDLDTRFLEEHEPTQWFTIFATLSVRGRAPAG